MTVRRLRAFLPLFALLALHAAAAPARAFRSSDATADPYEILPNALQSVHIDDTEGHAASEAMARHIEQSIGGRWRVQIWDPHAGTPRRVIGSGIDLSPGGFRTALDVDRVARAFIAAHPDVFHVDPSRLVIHRVTNALGKWVVLYQQTERGFRVHDAFVDLVFTDTGRLYAFGSSAYRGISIRPVPTLTLDDASQIARNALPFDSGSQLVGKPEATVVLPLLDATSPEGGMTFRLAHRIDVPTDGPYGLYETYVDAETGEVLRRENQVENAYSGTAQGDVEIPGYCAGNTANTPFANMNVVITGVGTAVTDATGAFSVAGSSGPHAFTASFDGPVVNVNCSGCGSDASLAGTIDPDVPEAIYFGSGAYRADERDCFYFINKTYDFIRQIDPTFTHAKVTANVNVASTCNANWGGTVLNFFRSGASTTGGCTATGGICANTGTIGDVMAHEYGHCIQNELLGGGQGTQGLGEGNADVAGTFIIDGSVIGVGFCQSDCANGLSCPGSGCRDCENTLQYPANVVGQSVHSAGRVICGVTWDMRQALEAKYGTNTGEIKAAEIWHFARKMFGNTSMTQPDQVAAYFVINDNDGDLTNGTPDYDEICGAATAHGFTCPTILTGVSIAHTPLSNTTDASNPYPVVATITTTDPPLVADSLRVHYRANGSGSYTSLLMTATGNPDEYRAFIPAAPCSTAIDYYITARDASGNTKSDPATAPAATHAFLVTGPIFYAQDFEAASDWTQDASHTATTGAFVRIDPNATSFQPGDDATPAPGIYGWITAQNTSDGVDDVDNGIAATRSPIIDLAGASSAHLSLKYFHGQRDAGDDANDFFRISLSNDGGTTYPVDLVSIGDVTTSAVWTALEVDLESVIALTSQMRIRVQAADSPTPEGDIVEGGVDDVLITGPCPPAGPDTIPPSVTVIFPNGGEALIDESTVDILWTATDNDSVTSVDLYSSLNSGASYTLIAAGEPNDGSYPWLASVPSPMQHLRVKVVAHDPASLTGEDESDADFIVGAPPSAPPSATLLGPNGGESIDATATAAITWTASDDIAVTSVDLHLSVDGGVTFPFTIVTGEANDGAYTWSVTDTATTQARVRVVASDANFQTAVDASDADFTITLAPTNTDAAASIPSRLFVGPNVPEPFTTNTRVRFGIPSATDGELAVYSVEGRRVKRLASGAMAAGIWERVWDGRDDAGRAVPAGLYFLKLSTAAGDVTHRMTFVR
jgi:hypothetical protein